MDESLECRLLIDVTRLKAGAVFLRDEPYTDFSLSLTVRRAFQD